MEEKLKCLYCNEKINSSNESSEHIIQNAIFGRLESKSICCNKCNNLLSKFDSEFCNQFSWITSISSPHWKKGRNSNKLPKYKVILEIDGKDYETIFKGKELISCQQFCKENKCSIEEIKVRLKDKKNNNNVTLNIPIDETILKKGLRKIATNFAAHRGIDINILKSNFEYSNNKIDYKAKAFPFIPLNSLDLYLEFGQLIDYPNSWTPYHCLILFTFENQLFCYVDLFNTYQWYICLSDNYIGEEIYISYLQIIEELDRTSIKCIEERENEEGKIFRTYVGRDDIEKFQTCEFEGKEKLNERPKNILFLQNWYGVRYNSKSKNPAQDFIKKINNKRNKVPYEQDISKFIANKIFKFDFFKYIAFVKLFSKIEQYESPANTLKFYFTTIKNDAENDIEWRLREGKFRKYNITEHFYYLYIYNIRELLKSSEQLRIKTEKKQKNYQYFKVNWLADNVLNLKNSIKKDCYEFMYTAMKTEE